MTGKRITDWVRKVKDYIALILEEDPVRPWSLVRHCIGAAVCNCLYEASIKDYFEMRFFDLPLAERKNVFTSYHAGRFITHVNGIENTRKITDKISMYQILGRFTKREQLFCPPESYQKLEAFFQRHKTALYKPSLVYCGTGIELWSIEKSNMDELYQRSLEQPAILDEPVIQHPDLMRINPDSVNTVKIFTLLIKNDCLFVAAQVRMGRRGSCVDNIERGGSAANVDVNTGAIVGDAYDLQRHFYAVHPDTGVPITGYVLPNWEEVRRFTAECARACPIAYVEWDIAIRENDCVLIEANSNARSWGMQMEPYHGRKKQFEELEKLYVSSIS